jgi:hypothetical protein
VGASNPLCLFSSSALHFVHHPVNQDDQHLLAHAMASDFSDAWQFLSENNSVFFVSESNSTPPPDCFQLFKFREMYEKRYHDSIGVSDLYKMKDIVTISEEVSGTCATSFNFFFFWGGAILTTLLRNFWAKFLALKKCQMYLVN